MRVTDLFGRFDFGQRFLNSQQQDCDEAFIALFSPIFANSTECKKVFEFVLKSTLSDLSCGCILSRSRVDPFLNLDVPISGLSVFDCLTAFCKKESVPDYNCVSHGLVPIKKQFSFSSVPEIFHIGLKVFDNTGRKTFFTSFDLILNLKVFFEPVSNNDLFFDLFAFVVHIGPSRNRGHYVSFVKKQVEPFCFVLFCFICFVFCFFFSLCFLSKGAWVFFNDQIVQPLNPLEYLNNEQTGTATIRTLFYRRRGVAPIQGEKRKKRICLFLMKAH